MENKKHKKFEKAQRRILLIKGFYHHLIVFVVFNAALLLSKNAIAEAIFGEAALVATDAMNWIEWNIYIWGAGLLVHGLFVFGRLPAFVKKWEDRQIKKYMNENKEY